MARRKEFGPAQPFKDLNIKGFLRMTGMLNETLQPSVPRCGERLAPSAHLVTLRWGRDHGRPCRTCTKHHLCLTQRQGRGEPAPTLKYSATAPAEHAALAPVVDPSGGNTLRRVFSRLPSISQARLRLSQVSQRQRNLGKPDGRRAWPLLNSARSRVRRRALSHGVRRT